MTSLHSSRLNCGGTCLHFRQAGRPARFPARRCISVRAELKGFNKQKMDRAGACLLSIALCTSCGLVAPDLQHPVARADEGNLSAYERRLAESQKRKELLAQARQNALSKGAQSDAIRSGEIEDPETAAANKEVEATNARRAEESERAMSAFRQKASDAYSTQSSKSAPGLKGIAYDPSEEERSAPAFSFSKPPEPLSVPKDPTTSPPETPSTVMNSSSESPIPSALAPAQSKQTGDLGQEIQNAFEGLFEMPSSPPSKAVPSQFSEPPESRPSATEPPPRAAFKAAPKEADEPAPQKAPEPAPQKAPEPAPKAPSEAPFNFLNESAPKKATEAAPKAVTEGPKKASEAASKAVGEPAKKAADEAAPKAKAVVKEPAKEVSKKDNKRRGPLPLFLAQFLVLAAYGGLGFLAFKKDEETRKAVAIVSGLAQKGYTKVQQLLPSGSK